MSFRTACLSERFFQRAIRPKVNQMFRFRNFYAGSSFFDTFVCNSFRSLVIFGLQMGLNVILLTSIEQNALILFFFCFRN